METKKEESPFFCWSFAVQKDWEDFLLLFPLSAYINGKCTNLWCSKEGYEVENEKKWQKYHHNDGPSLDVCKKVSEIQIFLGFLTDLGFLINISRDTRTLNWENAKLPYCKSFMAVHHQLSLMLSLAWHMYSSTAYFLYHISRSPLPIVMPRNTIPPM